jgi:alkylated DNA repair dioxygenase AlkB
MEQRREEMTESRQRGLFDSAEEVIPTLNASATGIVEGLVYVPGLLSAEAQGQLLREIDSQPWITELRRRVQHYGYRYDYRSRSVDHSMRIGELPVWALTVAALLQGHGLLSRPPDQVIVNEYEPGQGISNHIDCEPCFDSNIVSVSLGSACVMNFTRRSDGETVPVLLEAGSAVVLTGEARYGWMHGIPARKKDTFGGRIFARSRRVSLTYRKVILPEDASIG